MIEREKLVGLVVEDIVSGLPSRKPRFVYISGEGDVRDAVIAGVRDSGVNVIRNDSRRCDYRVSLRYFLRKYNGGLSQ